MDYDRQQDEFESLVDEVDRASHRYSQGAIQAFVEGVAELGCYFRTVNDLPAFNVEEMIEEGNRNRGSIAGSGRFPWPSKPLDKMAVRWHICKVIGEGKYQAWSFAHSFLGETSPNLDDNYHTFLDQVFTPLADALRRRADRMHADDLEREQQPLYAGMAVEIKRTPDPVGPSVFISHSSADEELAQAVVDLLSGALGLSSDDIRCTSLEGYKLPTGSETGAALRRESVGSRCFLALLTPSSIKSVYVIFELGARWGTEKPMFPVLGRGLVPGQLPSPLSDIHAANASIHGDVLDMVEDVARALGLELRRPGSWHSRADAVVTAASTSVSTGGNETILQPDASKDGVSDAEKAILSLLSQAEDAGRRMTPVTAIHSMGLGPSETMHYIDLLQERDFIGLGLHPNDGADLVWLESSGRKYVFDNNLRAAQQTS